jgi:superoxide dismutase
MRLDMTPVLILDLHAHAYQMDYPSKQHYVDRYFYYIDWEYVTELLVRTT